MSQSVYHKAAHAKSHAFVPLIIKSNMLGIVGPARVKFANRNGAPALTMKARSLTMADTESPARTTAKAARRSPKLLLSLWSRTDLADSVVSFLPAKAFARSSPRRAAEMSLRNSPGRASKRWRRAIGAISAKLGPTDSHVGRCLIHYCRIIASAQLARRLGSSSNEMERVITWASTAYFPEVVSESRA